MTPRDRAEQAVHLAKKELGIPTHVELHDAEDSQAIEQLAVEICMLPEAEFKALVEKHKPN